MELIEISQKMQDASDENVYLYFITRNLKDGFRKTSKKLDKYIYKVYQIDINDDIRKHLNTLSIGKLEYLIKRNCELHEYDVITDDTQEIFTYSMKDKAMAFSDVLTDLNDSPPRIKSLEELIAEEELWAYCVGFYCDKNDWIYSFRKILSGKVAIDEKDSNTKNIGQKVLRTVFNTKSEKLELIKGETVNLDKQLDCIYYNETFYVIKKTQFEQIIGLEEEYKIQAESVFAELVDTKMIEGLDVLKKEIEKNPALHKKLVRLCKIGNYRDLSEKIIKQMEKVCKIYGDKLKLKDGKILIEDMKDINLALKMLGDYYKRGEVSNKAYGTYAGKQLKTTATE